jgi:hypothetical protein
MGKSRMGLDFPNVVTNNSPTKTRGTRSMDILTTLRQPQWALPASAVAGCAVGYELLLEDRAEASPSAEIKADQSETKLDHIHGETETPHYREVDSAATTTTLPPDLSTGTPFSWDPKTGNRQSPSSLAQNRRAQSASADVAVVLIYDPTSGERIAEVFEPLVWAQGCPVFDSG